MSGILWAWMALGLWTAMGQLVPRAQFGLPAEVAGAASKDGRVWVWGDGLWERRERVWRQVAAGRFEAPGCVFGDAVVVQQKTDLVAVGMRDGRVRRIDTEGYLSDCLEATLYGRKGLLVAHRGLQVRFYDRGEPEAPRWPYREIYSFYTASYQAGLLQTQVDGDGVPDLFCGNYWIQGPLQFELPWRLFAINTHNETPESARFRLAMRGSELVASQGWVKGGKVLVFGPPADVRQLWREQELSAGMDLEEPRGLVVADLDRDGVEEIYVGEAAGAGRIYRWSGIETKASPLKIGAGLPIIGVLAVDWDRDGRRDLVVFGRRTGVWYRQLK
ncbi:MAG: VCBS repeat-containing protein [Bryobacterales bacterium]|nr:VCBS repeat-containing protein [Bryobacterales bacterium]